MKKISLLAILALVLLLGACNLPLQQPAAATPTMSAVEDDNALATPVDVDDIEVIPTNTTVPTQVPTYTAVPVEPTKEVVAVPTKTPTTQPTKTPAPTKKAEDVDTGDPAKFNGSADWSEDFSKAGEVNFTQDDGYFSKAEVVDSQYIFSAKNLNVPAWRMAGTGKKLGTSYVEATLTNITCHSNDDSSGLFFRSPDVHDPDQGYLFGVTCGGQYYVDMWNGEALPGGEMFTIIPAKDSNVIQKGNGQTNRVGVLSDDSGRSILYINGKPVDEFTSALFVDGYYGLMVKAATAEGFSVNIESTAVWYDSQVPNINHQTTRTDSVSTAELRPFAFEQFLTTPAQDPGVTLGTPTWRDYLNSAANWGANLNEYAIWTGNNYGELVVTGLQNESAWVLANTEKIGDGAIEVVMDNEDCYMWDSYGVFFRAPSLAEGDRGYLFGTTCHAHYFVWRWDGKSGRMDKLVDYTRDIDHINYGANERNRFDIVAVGDTVNFYINGYYMTSITDDYWTEGYFGVFVRPQYDGGLTIRVDEASYWINEPAE